VTHTAWIGAAGVAIFLVLAAITATGLARPIRTLENAATRFGRGDRAVRVTEDYGGEIGRLAHEFNTMADSLIQRENEINQRSLQLEAANKELAAFSYSVSHDLRSPLRTIDGFTRILEQDYASELSDEARRYLHLVRGGAQQMGTLIDDLLEFSRLGQRPIKKQKVDPATVVRQALSDLRAEQENRSVEIAIGPLPECDADPAMLRQVYANLLSNSLKFSRTRNPAVIEIGAISENGSTVYFVRDNGVGFDIKYAEKLFGVFQRLHRAEEFEGTGVGTAIAQRIVHRHGGAIWAEAQVDRGATFFFTLSPGVTNGS
ncbi:MAG: HAMP domain-containing protein, partial [Chloroflexi bacterium]|nr:HAMP domain-containing protein [Chloroflexota bacterium]